MIQMSKIDVSHDNSTGLFELAKRFAFVPTDSRNLPLIFVKKNSPRKNFVNFKVLTLMAIFAFKK